ncbi:hypothetical protein Dda3937_01750 [Dickeya dadantii 3937]|uniref:Uncharacterized protein n=1 Tax=Dickeya dadantii (strain 3937) TaxID=198628 RepID=E0SAJ8_DICD3|nr:hypothetical protein [Dickeya dadantii]ADM97056.1 hypothetical protein Dda3937_01750 [Dickeya dadantii 3937]
MKTRTKMEKIGLKNLSQEAKEKLTISIAEKSINYSSALKLKGFFGVSSVRLIIEQSIAHTASRLIIGDEDLLEHSKIDKLGLVKEIKFNERLDKKSPQHGEKEIRIKVMAWQLIIIASLSNDEINKVEDLVNFCLAASLKSNNSLFGEM